MLVSALATSAAVQSRCDAHTIAAAAVTIGVANDVPGGVTAVSTECEISSAPDAMTLIPCAGATRSTTEPRVDSFATWVEEPGASSPTPSTPGCEAGNLGLETVPLLPTAATTSAPESCRARSDSTSAARRLGRGRDIDDLRAIPAQPAERLQEAVLERGLIAAVLRLDDSGGQQRRVRHDAYDAHLGTVRHENARHRGAVPDGVVRRHLPACREMQQRRLGGREAVVVDSRVGHADDDSRGRALAEMDRLTPAVSASAAWYRPRHSPRSESSTGASRST